MGNNLFIYIIIFDLFELTFTHALSLTANPYFSEIAYWGSFISHARSPPGRSAIEEFGDWKCLIEWFGMESWVVGISKLNAHFAIIYIIA